MRANRTKAVIVSTMMLAGAVVLHFALSIQASIPPTDLASLEAASARSSAAPSEQPPSEIAVINDEATQPPYDPAGKRDPFRPLEFGESGESRARTALEQYDIAQLRLAAIVEDSAGSKAIVENSAGRGFPVSVGTKIGTSNGTVVAIKGDRLVIEETSRDLIGNPQKRTVEVKLRAGEPQKR